MPQTEFLCECGVYLKCRMHYNILVRSSTVLWVRIQILPLSLSSCVILGNLLKLSGQFPHRENGDNITTQIHKM